MTDEIFICFVMDYDDLYADLCNAVARALYNIPDEDPYSHTGKEPQTAANKIVDLLLEKSGDPTQKTSHERAFERLASHPAVVSGEITIDELIQRMKEYLGRK